MGVFELVRNGFGKLCPKCKNFAPLGYDGQCRCTRCGSIILKVSLEEAGGVKARSSEKA